uniref:Conserved hypothetical plastid protein n=1 Tax=Bulboplastis apyrenoidosa TaxID=1070855 RepID=A0A1Y9TMG6_9RHOD|nr:conserved hypothetical plastid protein [Bulboplastis apyrenoidosa]ARO90854.1 conserved hypothetical plastid protein [Bulboplastis apyrenoidosa]
MINFFKLTIQFIYFFFVSLIGLIITMTGPLLQKSNKRENILKLILLSVILTITALIFYQMLEQPV